MSDSPIPSPMSSPTPSTDPDADERADLLEALRKHRGLFRVTVQGLSDEQAASRPTVSELSLGGLVKHVSATEAEWARFVVEGPATQPDMDWGSIDWSNPPPEVLEYQNQFRMVEGDTLAGILARYDEVAAATDALVQRVDLAARHPLPAAPWFEPGATWSARRTFAHVVAETAQHAGHADILRETIDGQKSMG
ncbi:DinB family protein [Nocardioides sp. HDW12B]|uniref:DinB family protein n=1 Tax=Nocardioides sp. HDW12B TaxID=2714939 RepID=UPI001407391B|nr:DinB family protein [Nocardioides sp. HDW12B]QIK65529.1 DinB family protein [Nocardioides sp. HDW12B]